MGDADWTNNPYASPASEAGDAGDAAQAADGCDFGAIIRRWEQLRWYYNGFLTIAVLLATFALDWSLLGDLDYWSSLVAGAIIANLCFFAGPTIEGYGRYLRWWHPVFTIVLFLAGLGLATLLAMGCVLTYAKV